MVTVNTVLNEISHLSLDDQILIEEILHKRIIEERRNEIHKNGLESKKEYEEGKLEFSSDINKLKEMMDS